MDTQRRKILLEYMPAEALEKIINWLDPYPVSIRITRKRNTKMGDYRAPVRTTVHRISVNGDLYPDAFLVTLVHEIAHLVIWEKYRRKVKPHGNQWKEQFMEMLGSLTGGGIFHPEVEPIIMDFSSGRISYRSFNANLEQKVHSLRPHNGELLLGDIPLKAHFTIHNGRTFVKENKLRTRYRCKEIKSGKYYLISPLARVRLEPDVC